MTPRLTYFNTAVVGLLQVCVIVGATLGAGAAYKMRSTLEFPIPGTTQFAVDYGFIVIIVPLLWITIAMALQGRDEPNDGVEVTTFLSGILVLLLLLIGAFQAAIIPLFDALSPSCSFGLAT